MVVTVAARLPNFNTRFARVGDTRDHEWLAKFVEQRVGGRRVLRLIQKWLRAGVTVAIAREHLLTLRPRHLGPVVEEEASER